MGGSGKNQSSLPGLPLAVVLCPASPNNPTSLSDDTQDLRRALLSPKQSHKPPNHPSSPNSSPTSAFCWAPDVTTFINRQAFCLAPAPRSTSPITLCGLVPCPLSHPSPYLLLFPELPRKEKPLCRADCMAWVRIPNPHIFHK